MCSRPRVASRGAAGEGVGRVVRVLAAFVVAIVDGAAEGGDQLLERRRTLALEQLPLPLLDERRRHLYLRLRPCRLALFPRRLVLVLVVGVGDGGGAVVLLVLVLLIVISVTHHRRLRGTRCRRLVVLVVLLLTLLIRVKLQQCLVCLLHILVEGGVALFQLFQLRRELLLLLRLRRRRRRRRLLAVLVRRHIRHRLLEATLKEVVNLHALLEAWRLASRHFVALASARSGLVPRQHRHHFRCLGLRLDRLLHALILGALDASNLLLCGDALSESLAALDLLGRLGHLTRWHGCRRGTS